MNSIRFLFSLLMLATWDARADAVSADDLLSEAIYKGAIPCASVIGDKPDGYLNEATAVYLEPRATARLPLPEKIKATCATGGGDCWCFAMFFDEAPGPDEKTSYFQVFDQEKKKKLWVAGIKDKKTALTDLVIKKGSIEFRKPTPVIFTDIDRKTRITEADLRKIPADVEKNIRSEFPGIIGVLTIPVPKPRTKAMIKFTSLVKAQPVQSSKITDNTDLVFDTESSPPGLRKFNVVKREGDRFLVISIDGYEAPQKTMSGIDVGRYAFWVEVENAEFKFSPRTPVSIPESPLFSGFVYEIKETKTFSAQIYAKVEVGVLMDPILTTRETEGKIFKIREIWIPLTDEKGRLNFILHEMGGC